MVLSGWRAALVVIAGLLVVGLLLAAVFWIGVFLAVLALIGWFNLLLLPRIAFRLRIPELALAVTLLPLLAVAGFGLGGLSGLAATCAVWAFGVALPRAALWRFRRRLRQGPQGGTGLRRVRVIDASFSS